MKKILKLKLTKFELSLVGQVLTLEKPELFGSSAHVSTENGGLFLLEDEIILSTGKRIEVKYFDNNDERDRYLNKIIHWISAEHFTVNVAAEVGKAYEFRLSEDNPVRFYGELLAILPEDVESRYIVKAPYLKKGWDSFGVVCPFRYSPRIDGDVYSWSLPQ